MKKTWDRDRKNKKELSKENEKKGKKIKLATRSTYTSKVSYLKLQDMFNVVATTYHKDKWLHK